MRINGAALFSLALAAVAGFAAFAAAGWPFKAALFPLVLSIPLCALAITQLVLEVRGKPHQAGEAPSPGDGRRIAAIFAWMAVFIVLVVVAGFPAAVPVFILSYLLTHRVAGPVLAIAVTAAAWGLFHLLFVRLLHFPFETGLIQEWLAK
jgi:Tripartite tricarboxylate transporter TctB family